MNFLDSTTSQKKGPFNPQFLFFGTRIGELVESSNLAIL